MLNIRDFKDANRLLKILRQKFSTIDNFDNVKVKIILNEKNLKNWLFITEKNFWFIIDNGRKGKIYHVSKNEFNFNPEEIEEGFANLLIPSISYPIMFDKTLTGSTSSFINYLNTNKNG